MSNELGILTLTLILNHLCTQSKENEKEGKKKLFVKTLLTFCHLCIYSLYFISHYRKPIRKWCHTSVIFLLDTKLNSVLKRLAVRSFSWFLYYWLYLPWEKSNLYCEILFYHNITFRKSVNAKCFIYRNSPLTIAAGGPQYAPCQHVSPPWLPPKGVTKRCCHGDHSFDTLS